VESTFRRRVVDPQDTRWQELIVSGTWLADYGSTEVTGTLDVEVPQAGTYALYSPGF